MAEKLTPYVGNALTPAAGTSSSDSPYLFASQETINEIVNGGSAEGGSAASGGIEEAPKDGNFYARKDGAWVKINQVSAVIEP